MGHSLLSIPNMDNVSSSSSISFTRCNSNVVSVAPSSIHLPSKYIELPQSLFIRVIHHFLKSLLEPYLEVNVLEPSQHILSLNQVIPTFLKKVGYVSHRFFESSSLAVKVFFRTNTFHVVSEDLPQLYSFASFFGTEVQSVFLYSNLTSKVEDFLGHSSIITGLKLNLDETIDLEFLNKTSLYFPRLKQLHVQASSSISMLLIELLKGNDSVTEVNLGGNSFGNEGTKALAEALKINSKVKTIDLSCNSIGAEGARALADALKVNTTVTSVDLCENSVGAEGAIYLAELLKLNSTLTSINLSQNSIGVEGATALAEALKVNNTIKRINLMYNSIGFEGSRALIETLKVNKTSRRIAGLLVLNDSHKFKVLN
ncbi:hypothetical protein GEMRC1_012335 [Eukaryota sp. GEM-RC1]